ncbi:hypothetical protein Vafri_15814 [Volvox africanus]|uniref:Uncharacterized protein n=1 Tax=Volvox africanus TaxID=51714 RepID=A0A8J4F4Z2_9CHLO|nr:hypothetical protein Vafri_15814 [Volvox africanus]
MSVTEAMAAAGAVGPLMPGMNGGSPSNFPYMKVKTGLTPNFGGWHGPIPSFGSSGMMGALLPEWPPGGSIGSAASMMMLGMSPGGELGMSYGNTYGKSVDMLDMCAQLMEAGVVDPLSNLGSLRNELMLPPDFKNESVGPCGDPDLDEHEHDLDEMMILGTTPDFARTPTDHFFRSPCLPHGFPAHGLLHIPSPHSSPGPLAKAAPPPPSGGGSKAASGSGSGHIGAAAGGSGGGGGGAFGSRGASPPSESNGPVVCAGPLNPGSGLFGHRQMIVPEPLLGMGRLSDGEGLAGCPGDDDDDELMGMSPDIPTLKSINGPFIRQPGFGTFLKQQAAKSAVAAASGLMPPLDVLGPAAAGGSSGNSGDLPTALSFAGGLGEPPTLEL